MRRLVAGMRGLVYQGPHEVSVKNVPDPRIEQLTDVLVRVTSTNICGVSHQLPLERAPEACQHFDARDDGWTKVVLKPAMATASA